MLGLTLVEHANINVNVYTLNYWKLMIKENVVWALLCLYLPPEYVWKESVKFSFTLRKLDLRAVTLMDVEFHWKKAKRQWNQNRNVAKKNFVHALRWLEYALQLVQHHRLIDLYEPNKYWHEVHNGAATAKIHNISICLNS